MIPYDPIPNLDCSVNFNSNVQNTSVQYDVTKHRPNLQ